MELDRLNAIAYRRQILDWRDRWIFSIDTHFSKQIYFFFSIMDRKIDAMSYKQLIFSNDFYEKQIEPLFQSWIRDEVKSLSDNIQQDLSQIQSRVLAQAELDEHKITCNDNSAIVESVQTGGLLVTSLAGAGVVAAFSTTTVSAGGILGFVGFTTTVIAWPVVVVGGVAVLGALSLSGSKGMNIKNKGITNYKAKAHEALRTRLLVGQPSTSCIVDQIQQSIEDTSDALLAEIIHVH